MQTRRKSTSHTHRLHGHTLLELLITFPLGLAVTLAGVSLYRAQHVAFEQITERSQLVEDGWAALHLIATYLRIAGFSSPLSTQQEDVNSLGLFGCTASHPAKGYICKTQKGEYSDGIEISYQANTVSSAPTNCLGQKITPKNPKDTQVQVINRFSARMGSSSGKPELYCEGVSQDDRGRQRNYSQPLVAGVERLYLRYRLGHASNMVDADAIAPNQWNQVTLVQLCVVMRGEHRAARSTYIDCEGKRITSDDGLPRQALTTWVALRNRLNTQSSNNFAETEP